MLQEYKRKRDFQKTPEPSGMAEKKSRASSKSQQKGLSFVIQKHDATRLHYDFRLEVDGVMVSWAVPKGPSLSPADKRLAVMTEDHPMAYSDFEGIIPEKQYGAGEVIIWDQGYYSPDEDNEYSWDDLAEANSRMRSGLKKGKLSFYLKGEKLEGSWTLVKMQKTDKQWLLIKHKDEFVDEETDITESDKSVVTGKSIEDLQNDGAWTAGKSKRVDPESEGKSAKKAPAKVSPRMGAISKSRSDKKKEEQAEKQVDLDELLNSGKRAAMPHSVSPMLATLVDAPFHTDGWFFEPKLDGVRAIALVHKGKCELRSRQRRKLSFVYHHFAL